MDNQLSYFIRLSSILEAMPDALVIVDNKGRIILINRQTENLFGYERTELLGEFVEQLMPERFRKIHPDHRDSYFNNPRVRPMGIALDLFGLKRNGVEFPIEISLSPLKTEEGQFSLAAIRDITIRKKSEAKFKSIIEATPDCLVIINNRGEIILVNALTETLFGYKPEEIIGKKVEVLIPKRFHSNHKGHRSDYFTQPRVRPMGVGLELYGLHKDGHEFPVEISLSPLETEEGTLALAAIRNISERKKIEDAKAMLSAIVAFSDDAIVGKDINGKVFSWNSAAERLYGYSSAEMIGKSITAVFPPNYKTESDMIMKTIKNGESIKHLETERQNKNGKKIPVSITVSPIKNAQGILIGASTTARDITAQKNLEDALRSKNMELEEKNRQVEEANRLKSVFLANMSHELRTPLNGIIGFSELMYYEKAGALTDIYKEYTGDILSCARQLLRLIDDILDLSKIESGKMKFYPGSIDVKELLNEVFSTLNISIAKKCIDASITIDPTIGKLVIDPTKLKQVFYNYISNAIKFTPEGGYVKARILPENDNYFRFEVEDSGIGIQDADKNKLFIEFQQLDESASKKYQGTGLGLALTKRIVEAQGGRVGFSSAMNKGSIFYAILPRIFTDK